MIYKNKIFRFIMIHHDFIRVGLYPPIRIINIKFLYF